LYREKKEEEIVMAGGVMRDERRVRRENGDRCLAD
jgi:hypothetical protein